MKRHMIAFGASSLFPLVSVGLVIVATAAEAAALGIHRLVHR